MRVFLSIVFVLFVVGFNFFSNIAAPVISGNSAVLQLNNNNADYVAGQVGVRIFQGKGVSIFMTIVVLMAIWIKPFMRWLATFMLLTLMVVPGYGYYDVKDNPEFIEIGPNQTAFVIPMAGANKDSQGQFMSEEYLTANKVAAKRIQIPHVEIKTSWMDRNYFVPAVKVIIVDRISYNREWTKSNSRGTSNKDESIYCESADSININTAVTIGASIEEKNAAKFLYYWGTRPAVGKPDDPNVMYASVLHAKSLQEVMDTIGRGKVQSILAREFGKRPTDDAIKQKADCMSITEKETREYFIAKGVNIEYVGFAEGLTLDGPVQTAINQVYIASKQAQSLPVLDKLADIEIKRSVAIVASKWNGALPQLPSWLILPESWTNAILSLFKKDGK